MSEINNQLVKVTVDKIRDLYKKLAEKLQFVTERNIYYYNQKYNQKPILKERNKVYLVKKNINIKRLSNKLNYKKLKPFKIKQIKRSLNYKLALLKIINIFSVFYIFLFKKALLKALSTLITEI